MTLAASYAAAWATSGTIAAGRATAHVAAAGARRAQGTTATAARATGGAITTAAPVVGEYIADKSQDVAAAAIISAANPLTLPTNTFTLAISLGSTGDRRWGAYGFAMYENCRGLCQLGPKRPYTPGFLGFHRSSVDPRTFAHENQHAIQAAILGEAYLPFNIAVNATCGFTDPCMHDRNPLEVDAKAAQKDGLHIPFTPISLP